MKYRRLNNNDKPCSACGAKDWIIPNEEAALMGYEEGMFHGAKGLPVIYSICRNCGYIRLFVNDKMYDKISSQKET